MITTAILCTGSLAAENTAPNFGVLNFHTLAADSKLGKQENASFEAMRTQMVSMLEETRKQAEELEKKLADPEFRDSLSPEADAEHQTKLENFKMDLQRYRAQYAQVMEQAQMRFMQAMTQSINTASDTVRKNKNLLMIVHKDACPSVDPSLDVTQSILEEMDSSFEEAQKKLAAKAEEATESAKSADKVEEKKLTAKIEEAVKPAKAADKAEEPKK